MKTLAIIAMLTIITNTYAQTSICFNYDVSGNRASRMVSSNGCGKSIPKTTTKSNTTDSLANKQLQTASLGEMKITLYPNPTKGQLTIAVSNIPINTHGEIVLCDLSGKLIFTQNTIQANTLLDLSAQSKGIYVLKIWAGDKLGKWKVIKQ
jgi:hypothetical protein